MIKKIIFSVSLLLVLLGIGFFTYKKPKPKTIIDSQISLSPSPIISPSPSPSPSPLSFAQMNALYGPCVYLPTLMYHHVEDLNKAKTDGHSSLTVGTDIFRAQMEYLKARGYTSLSMQDLAAFFNSGTALPGKGVLLTFDDGYDDFYSDAYPILSSLGFKATVFMATGLADNPGYLSWSQIDNLTASGNVLMANHTWSHKGVGQDMQKEISLADSQLAQHNANIPKVFSYPFGYPTGKAENYLSGLGYTLAFTTNPGSILCAKNRLSLPRTRIGNTPKLDKL